MSNNPDTVSFDVGGKPYRVSRSLIERFPSTMLARMTSETWKSDRQKEPIFIERDGERFRYCLDYMRDGHACIHFTVSKDALLRDLEYFGFEDVSPAAIDYRGSTGLAVAHVAESLKEAKSKAADLGRQSDDLAFERDCVLFAAEVVEKYIPAGTLTFSFYGDPKKGTKEKMMFETLSRTERQQKRK